MSDENEPPYMMCMRKTEETLVLSYVRMCALCTHEIWITPVSLDICEKHKAKLVCMECFLARMENLPPGREVKIMPPSAGQMQEIKENL